MFTYIRGFIVLFVLLALLLHLIPRSGYQKYIRFFAELILMIGILSPVMSLFFDSEEFMERIEYQEFTETISEITRDMERIEYLQQDYYLHEYETAIALDVQRMAEDHGFEVQEANVCLTGEYRVDSIQLCLADSGRERVQVERITLKKEGEEGEDVAPAYAGLVQDLSDYYGLAASQIKIVEAIPSSDDTADRNSGKEGGA